MQDLRAAVKGGVDPNGIGSSVVAADVLWSDPVAEPGLRANVARGVGLIFGPDVTQVPMIISHAHLGSSSIHHYIVMQITYRQAQGTVLLALFA